MTWTGGMSARVEQAKDRTTGCWWSHTLNVMEVSKSAKDSKTAFKGRRMRSPASFPPCSGS